MDAKETNLNSNISNNENGVNVEFTLSQDDDTDLNTVDHNEKQKNLALSLLKTRSGRCIKYNSDYLEKNLKKRERQNLIYQIKKALGKTTSDRTQDDLDLLQNFKDLVHEVDLSARNRQNALQHQEIVVDDQETLQTKCEELANAIFNSKGCVIYTGAGISTSASIPDYRGPNGLWTMLERGVKIEMPDFALVDPTYSHMALSSMMKLDLVKYIVSQNWY
jgi:NAD-dependent deacetylase sirtuin 7